MMDRGPKLGDYMNYPMPTGKIGKQNIAAAIQKVFTMAARDGVDPTHYNMIVDTGGSTANIGLDKCPCITRSRAGAHAYWSLNHGRRHQFQIIDHNFSKTRMT